MLLFAQMKPSLSIHPCNPFLRAYLDAFNSSLFALQLKLILWLVSMKACFAEYKYDESYSACSENLPESQRLKRNCPPLIPMLLHYIKRAVCNDGSPAGSVFH